MVQLKESWYDAIKIRKSRRRFTGEPIHSETLEQMEESLLHMNSGSEGVRGVIVTTQPDKVFKGIIGSYGKIKNPPAYIAFIGNMKDGLVQEKLGYFGESVILEATSKGLATCWIGGFFDEKVVKQQISLKDDEKVLAVTPIGYSPEAFESEEKLMSLSVSSHKRKPLTDLVQGLAETEWPSWIRSGLEAARLAPSAVNRQPWRFRVEADEVTVKIDHNFLPFGISKRLDCGIAMLHFELGAFHEGVRGSWSYLNTPEVARFRMENN